MLQKILNNYSHQRPLVPRIFSNICLAIHKNDSIFFLKTPKLLYDLAEDSSNNMEIEIPNIINPSYAIKNEKKSKLNFRPLDNIENKKNKVKQKKKVRSKIYLDKDFAETTEDLELNNLSSLTFLRPPKNLKNKKINKNKVVEKNNILPRSIDCTETLSLNDTKQIYIENLLTVQELAEKLKIPSTEIIKWLFLQGISVTINQSLDLSISTLVAENYSFIVLREKFRHSSFNVNIPNKFKGQSRSPVVTILGHVDHGKTTLLNFIRQNNKFKKEAGNITQAIGSYEVLLNYSQEIKKIIFLDTPGHEAFISMRRRGAEITDIVILVVSADDGLKPQTIEAIDHIQKRNLPFIVAINKIDKTEANINKVINQLSSFNILSDSVPIIGVSALTGENIDLLLSNLIKLSEAQNLQSDSSQLSEGIILESYLDKQKGPIAKLLIQNGTLFTGSFIVSGNFYCKVKALFDNSGNKVISIEANALAEILGFSSVPDVGLSFRVVKDEKVAKLQSSSYIALKPTVNSLNNRIALDSLDLNGSRCIIKQINLIIKTDAQGSIEPILHAFSKIPQEKVQVNILSIALGEISLKDIQLAFTSNSSILAFNINIPSAILDNAENSLIIVKQFNIIYDLIDYIKNYMLSFVDIQYTKEIIGHAEVKSLFIVNKGMVAGCSVLDGKLKKSSYISVLRKGKIIYNGLINSLKREKEDFEEVLSGYECGLMCKDFNLWEVNDKIEAYFRKPLEKSL
uniref:translation initiation factor IF-2 n=1 Tax=Synarthrophyton patena TaxID=48972 RepID=UPI0021823844|nr:translation initiation factor IF-2 [Synarthrophyton patena]UVF62945.1 translation initiation factor IF-2 [Synarthrophyton patena]